MTVRKRVAVFDEPAGRVPRSPEASRGMDLTTIWVQPVGGVSVIRIPGWSDTSLGCAEPTRCATSIGVPGTAPAQSLAMTRNGTIVAKTEHRGRVKSLRPSPAAIRSSSPEGLTKARVVPWQQLDPCGDSIIFRQIAHPQIRRKPQTPYLTGLSLDRVELV